jgi:hypothetical protein
VAAYVIEHDATIIRDDIPTVETPFESQTEIIGVPKRMTRAGQKAAAKRKRQRYGPHHKDKEINEAIRKFGEDNVHIIEDSNP